VRCSEAPVATHLYKYEDIILIPEGPVVVIVIARNSLTRCTLEGHTQQTTCL
jgi:hypothetical protein